MEPATHGREAKRNRNWHHARLFNKTKFSHSTHSLSLTLSKPSPPPPKQTINNPLQGTENLLTKLLSQANRKRSQNMCIRHQPHSRSSTTRAQYAESDDGASCIPFKLLACSLFAPAAVGSGRNQLIVRYSQRRPRHVHARQHIHGAINSAPGSGEKGYSAQRRRSRDAKRGPAIKSRN